MPPAKRPRVSTRQAEHIRANVQILSNQQALDELMAECTRRPELTMKILQNIRTGLYDEPTEAAASPERVAWPRSYTKARHIPDKFLRVLLPKMEPDNLSEVEIGPLVFEEKKHLLYFALQFKDDTILPKGITFEDEMVAKLVDQYNRLGSVLSDVSVGDDGSLDWTTQVGFYKFDAAEKTLLHRRSGLTVAAPDANFSLPGWHLKLNWFEEEAALTNPAVGASWQLFTWFRLQGHLLREATPRLLAPAGGAPMMLQDQTSTPQRSPPQTPVTTREPRLSPPSDRMPSRSPQSEKSVGNGSGGVQGNHHGTRRRLSFPPESSPTQIESVAGEEDITEDQEVEAEIAAEIVAAIPETDDTLDLSEGQDAEPPALAGTVLDPGLTLSGGVITLVE